MKKTKLYFVLFGFLILPFSASYAQTLQTIQEANAFINDALFYSDKFITPATDGVVYQSSSAWVTSPKKRKLWDVTFGVNANLFFVPNKDKDFQIKNSDFSFFEIENASTASVPTANGGLGQNYLVGQLAGQEVRIKAPNGVRQDVIFYPHLSAGVSIWYGTEVLVKYAPKTNLKHGDFKVYGFGLKHNIDQYFKSLEAKKIHISGLLAYSKSDMNFDFIDSNSNFGSIGINRISALVDTYQFQINASKEFKKFELMTGIIANSSGFEYKLSGDVGIIESIFPLQSTLNNRLKEIQQTKTNVMGEISGRYQFSKIFVQTTIAFGKFVNSNVSVQYEF
jgi:hypothetical protein